MWYSFSHPILYRAKGMETFGKDKAQSFHSCCTGIPHLDPTTTWDTFYEYGC